MLQPLPISRAHGLQDTQHDSNLCVLPRKGPTHLQGSNDRTNDIGFGLRDVGSWVSQFSIYPARQPNTYRERWRTKATSGSHTAGKRGDSLPPPHVHFPRRSCPSFHHREDNRTLSGGSEVSNEVSIDPYPRLHRPKGSAIHLPGDSAQRLFPCPNAWAT